MKRKEELFKVLVTLDRATWLPTKATGTVRDHADGREAVSRLEYEAYEEEVEARLAAIAFEARRREPTLGRLVLLHRVGMLEVGEASVVVVAMVCLPMFVSSTVAPVTTAPV